MIGGASFQPGIQEYGQSNGDGRQSSGSGVQEAIKILSLRLPRVVGAQSAAPMPLLTSQGSGGNSRIDSIINQVMQRVMGGQQGQPSMPMQPSRTGGSGPSFTGAAQTPYQPEQPPPAPWMPPSGFRPRVVVDAPFTGTDADLSGGGGQPPGMIGTLPPNFQFPAPAPSPVPDLNRISGGGSGQKRTPFDQPLF